LTIEHLWIPDGALPGASRTKALADALSERYDVPVRIGEPECSAADWNSIPPWLADLLEKNRPRTEPRVHLPAALYINPSFASLRTNPMAALR
jgi:hypothetical protein